MSLVDGEVVSAGGDEAPPADVVAAIRESFVPNNGNGSFPWHMQLSHVPSAFVQIDIVFGLASHAVADNGDAEGGARGPLVIFALPSIITTARLHILGHPHTRTHTHTLTVRRQTRRSSPLTSALRSRL